jgi:spermidine synthase
MIPWQTVDRARAPDGAEWTLSRRGEEWAIRAGGQLLMSSRQHGSEEALAERALARVARARAVLVGGLGMGYTVRAVLDRLAGDAKVVVVELVPELAAWNRGPLAGLAGRPLDDPRVRLQRGDVLARIAEAREAYDAILLDVDNGPSAVGRPANGQLYGDRGVRACRDALRRGGVLAVWSAGPDAPYLRRLERAGLAPAEEIAAARGADGGVRHAILLGQKPMAAAPARPRAR